MKLLVDRAQLHAALGRVAKIVEARSTIPILSFLRLRAQEGSLTLAGTDLDLEATTSAAAEVGAPGAATVSAKALADIVSKLPAGAQVAMEAEGARMTIRSGRSRFTLPTLPVEDYPSPPALKSARAFALDAQTLAARLGQVAFAISTEETRYYLNGVFLHVHAGEDGPMLRLVATDGHRLARLEFAAPEGADGLAGIIIPSKTVSEVRRLGKDAEGEVAIESDGERIGFRFAHKGATTTLVSKTIEGTFPDYARVIPADNWRVVHAARETLAAAVERVATMRGGERGRAVRVALDAGRLTLAVSNPDLGEAVEEVDITYDADPLEIGFNSAYLAEILATLAAPEVEIRLNSAGSPAIVQDRGETNLLTVLMPMRI